MEPLASLNGLRPLLGPSPSAGITAPSRESNPVHAPGQERPVELWPDRVDSPDPTTAKRGGMPVGEEGVLSDRGSDREGSVELPQPDPRFSAPNEAITYRLYPDLPRVFQARIIDRGTTDTVRAIPPDVRIELAVRMQDFLGVNLDESA